MLQRCFIRPRVLVPTKKQVTYPASNFQFRSQLSCTMRCIALSLFGMIIRAMRDVRTFLMGTTATNHTPEASSKEQRLAFELRRRVESEFADFPYKVVITDWCGNCFSVGKNGQHWANVPLEAHIKTAEAGKDVAALDGLQTLERFRKGEIDLTGNLYLLSELRDHARLKLSPLQLFRQMLQARILQFQDLRRARKNIKTHYDIPQVAIDLYLDRVYKAYSCAMFLEPHEYKKEELTTYGQGKHDDFDSLEKAQWRKFKDAVDFINPGDGDTLLDVGCGYGGQLSVALDTDSFSKVVGCTLSENQAREGRKLLEEFNESRWELHEGDYREDDRVFDHITSTGMISHVGPRGLVPYIRQIRRRIRTGGRYVHHAIMARYFRSSLDSEIGIAFNKMYVWPGFHWFTFGQHVKALEQNGFVVKRAVNLAPHYAKTVAAWYERMMENSTEIKALMGDEGFRAWQVYLSGGSQGLLSGRGHVYRLYCEAV